MEFSKEEMKDYIRKIYARLDKVSPVDFDCGELCGEICCVYDLDDDAEELALYLLPGEELMYEDNDSFQLYYLDSSEIRYPHSWRGQIYLVKCTNPPKCDRSIRPIQCRTFPLIPHISKDGQFHLIVDEEEFPYICPLVHDGVKLNEDFILETYNIWKVLARNPLVFDLIDMDSRKRDNCNRNYQIII